MMTIWKFEHVQVDDTAQIKVKGATVLQWLHAEPSEYTGELTVWAVVNTVEGDHVETAEFECRGTGHQLTGGEGAHFATVIDHSLVWHLFHKAGAHGALKLL